MGECNFDKRVTDLKNNDFTMNGRLKGSTLVDANTVNGIGTFAFVVKAGSENLPSYHNYILSNVVNVDSGDFVQFATPEKATLGKQAYRTFENGSFSEWVVQASMSDVDFSNEYTKIDGSNINPTTWANLTAGKATTWETSRNFTIGNTTKSVNGSANVSWSLAEIGINTGSFVPYTGANQAVNLNTQSLTIGGDFEKTASTFERSYLTSGLSSLHFTRLTDVASFSRGNDNTTTSDCIVITLPIRSSTRWVMEVDIFSPSTSSIFPGAPTKLLISAYSIRNTIRSVTAISSADNVKSVSFCRDIDNNTIIIIRSNRSSNFNYGKVNITNFYHGVSYNSDLAVKSNYRVDAVLESSLTGLTTNGTITNEQFDRDSYYLDYNNFTNKPVIPTSSDFITTNTHQTGLSGNKTTSGIWTFNNQINTANHGNSAQWKQAFDWGDHAGKYFGRGDKYGVLIDANTAPDGILTGSIWANTPSSGIATLTTIQYSPDWITQTFELINEFNETWVRKKHSGTTWTSWVKIWNYGNLADPATQTWVSNNFLGSTVANNTFVRKAGDIMTGILNVPALYSDTLTSTNKQLIQPNGSTIFWGNPQINTHIFESTGANSLLHYMTGVGHGTIWTAHNFNPASKANANNTITINGSTQMLGNNPNFTVSGGGTPTRIGANGAGYVAGDITFYGQGNTTVTQNGTDVYIASGGGAGGGSAGFDEVLPFTGIGGQPDNYTLFRVASRQTAYQGMFNYEPFTDIHPASSLINVTGIYEGYEFDGSVGQRIKSSGSFMLAQHAQQYARDNMLVSEYPYLVLLDDYQTNQVEAQWMSPAQVFQLYNYGDMRGGAKLIGYLVETIQHEICFEFNQQILILRDFVV